MTLFLTILVLSHDNCEVYGEWIDKLYLNGTMGQLHSETLYVACDAYPSACVDMNYVVYACEYQIICDLGGYKIGKDENLIFEHKET